MVRANADASSTLSSRGPCLKVAQHNCIAPQFETRQQDRCPQPSKHRRPRQAPPSARVLAALRAATPFKRQAGRRKAPHCGGRRFALWGWRAGLRCLRRLPNHLHRAGRERAQGAGLLRGCCFRGRSRLRWAPCKRSLETCRPMAFPPPLAASSPACAFWQGSE